jgi:hypothetical protein
MSNFKRKSLSWLAPVAMVGAIGLAACGDEDATETATAGAAAVGSDQHLKNQAAEIADQATQTHGSDQHLENQAAEIGEQSAETDGSDQHLENQAAEIGEQSAETVAGDGAPNPIEAGNRAVELELNGDAAKDEPQPTPQRVPVM